MSKQLIFVIAALGLLFAFFYSVSDIMLPFVAGIGIAYMLDPAADKLCKNGFGRNAAAGIITILFFSIIVAFCLLIFPLIYHQLEGLFAKIPDYYDKFNTEILPLIQEKLARIDPQFAQGVSDQTDKIPAKLGSVAGGIVLTGFKFLNLASLILITPIVAFYILRDWDKFLARVDNLLPRNYAPIVRAQAKKIDDTLASFVRGQLNVCLLLGVFYGTALTLAGLNFGFIIGLGAGFLTFIPYVGPLTGGLVGMVVAYFQFGEDWTQLGIILAIFVIGQIAEGNFITPKLVGGKIGVHPAWLIFGMLAGGSLLGFVGVLISVPLTAIIAVLIRFVIEQYEESEIYNSTETVPLPAPEKAKETKAGKTRKSAKKKTQSP